MGLKDIKPIKKDKKRIVKKYHHFTQWYTLKINKKLEEFKVNKEEVAEIKWFSKEELLKELENNPNEFIPTLQEYIDMLIEY